jgi:hypothetical protein
VYAETYLHLDGSAWSVDRLLQTEAVAPCPVLTFFSQSDLLIQSTNTGESTAATRSFSLPPGNRPSVSCRKGNYTTRKADLAQRSDPFAIACYTDRANAQDHRYSLAGLMLARLQMSKKARLLLWGSINDRSTFSMRYLKSGTCHWIAARSCPLNSLAGANWDCLLQWISV